MFPAGSGTSNPTSIVLGPTLLHRSCGSRPAHGRQIMETTGVGKKVAKVCVGDCVQGGGEEEGDRVKERALGRLLATPLDIEVDPQRRRICREADFARQRLVNCSALEPERVVRLVVCDGSPVKLNCAAVSRPAEK